MLAKLIKDPTQIIPSILTWGLFIFNLLPILAPILVAMGEKNISSAIYWIYQFTCHQKASRSFFICDNQCGWCARCTFLWFSTFITAYITFMTRIIWSFKGLRTIVAVLLVLPLILDGGIQFIATAYSLWASVPPFYESTNSIRAITGILFGTGLGLYFFPRLRDELREDMSSN
ncbi:MAG: hypothetical protein KatS3mg084_0552 [Candidatus Dojkabacteria bacterium]|nr:MAG: hypothetical protein KatS3mg084_0552 [Candidatus Dojkabacteria bacterium]